MAMQKHVIICGQMDHPDIAWLVEMAHESVPTLKEGIQRLADHCAWQDRVEALWPSSALE